MIGRTALVREHARAQLRTATATAAPQMTPAAHERWATRMQQQANWSH